MILLADSGSTKTDWYAISESGKHLFQTKTLGLNPQVLTLALLRERIVNNFELIKIKHQVTHVYFYSAGCGVEEPRQIARDLLAEIFDHAAVIEVKEDTYAAVYAVYDKGEPSLVNIIGTGSNCCYYDGKEVSQEVLSLGYILMDDASGNYFGKRLVRDYHFKKMPEDLRTVFGQEYDVRSEIVKNHLYKRPNPNTYLATFARFLITNHEHPYCQEIIDEGFDIFVSHQILLYPSYKEVPVHFVGSISFYLKKELKRVLDRYGIQMGKVLKRPIDGLVAHHIQALEAQH